MQFLATKKPVPLLVKPTVPVGVFVALVVSVTVAVHVVVWLTTTAEGEQATLVVVPSFKPIVSPMTTERAPGPLVPVKLRWKLPLGVAVVAETVHDVELVSGVIPFNNRLLRVQDTERPVRPVELFVS